MKKLSRFLKEKKKRKTWYNNNKKKAVDTVIHRNKQTPKKFLLPHPYLQKAN